MTVDDPILARASAIGRAIASRRYDADKILLIVSGDIAFSGTQQQYNLAQNFISEIKRAVGDDLVSIVAPGNHDCDFNSDQTIRNIIIDRVESDDADQYDSSVEAQCLTVQESFRAFKAVHHSTTLHGDQSLLVDNHRIDFETGYITVRVYNTAWLSKIKELPGTLVFPIAEITKTEGFVISVFHHPYNWQKPNSARRFRRAIEATSTLVLTGHEHEHDRRLAIARQNSAATDYIEGSALQETGKSNTSEFNLIFIDVENAKQRFFHFALKGDSYEPNEESDWESLHLRKRKLHGIFEFTAAFQKWLSDVDIPGLTRGGQSVQLKDIYIFPDLLESPRDITLTQKRRTVKGADLFATISNLELALISGPPKSGKTALAKSLITEYFSSGLVPLYLDASKTNFRFNDGTSKFIERQVIQQYGDGALESYLQLDPSDRVIIIDNLDRTNQRGEIIISQLRNLRDYAAHTIVLGDDGGARLTELVTGEGPSALEGSYEVQQFNAGLRERFAQKWFDFESSIPLDEVAKTQRLRELSETLNIVLGRKYVPAFPVFVIAVVSAFEANANVDSQRASTHGYFYSLLIQLALLKNDGARDINVRLAVLTHFAFEMFERGTDRFLKNEIVESFVRYQKKHKVGRLEFGAFLDGLIEHEMLVRDADSVKFRYPYLYFYFVAQHLSNTISNPESRQHIENLTQNVGTGNSADILMFVAHKSNDRFVAERLLKAANDFFPEQPAATLASVLPKIVKASDVKFVYVEKRTTEARVLTADNQDAQTAIANESDATLVQSGDAGALRANRSVSAAVQMIRILGQMLKNFPGTLDAEIKTALIDASYNLGLRCLTMAFKEIEIGRKRTIEAIVTSLRREYPNLSDDKLGLRADNFIWLLYFMVSHGIVKIVSNAVASPELEPIYEEALIANATVAKKLIDMSLKLDISKSFPQHELMRLATDLEDETLALLILRTLVVGHFSEVEVLRPVRQSVCKILKIDYQLAATVPPKALKPS